MTPGACFGLIGVVLILVGETDPFGEDCCLELPSGATSSARIFLYP